MIAAVDQFRTAAGPSYPPRGYADCDAPFLPRYLLLRPAGRGAALVPNDEFDPTKLESLK